MNLLSFAARHIDGYNLFLTVVIGSLGGIAIALDKKFYQKERFQRFAKNAEKAMGSLLTILIFVSIIVTMKDHDFDYAFFVTMKIMLYSAIGVITGSSFCSLFSNNLLEKIFFWEIPLKKRGGLHE